MGPDRTLFLLDGATSVSLHPDPVCLWTRVREHPIGAGRFSEACTGSGYWFPLSITDKGLSDCQRHLPAKFNPASFISQVIDLFLLGNQVLHNCTAFTCQV